MKKMYGLFSKFLLPFIGLLLYGCIPSHQNPPPTLQPSDLLGTWEVSYSEQAQDKLILGEHDFRQIYQDAYGEGHSFAVSGGKWWLDRLPNGFMRLHLQGAKYFRVGVDFSDHFYFYDPFVNEMLGTEDGLILEVRVTQGELLLYHLTTDPDSGATSVFGNERNMFRRVFDQ